MKISLESFQAVLRRSGLIPADRIASLLEEFRTRPGDPNDSKRFADFLIEKSVLTPWQSEKLLQGKHKGFFLGKYRLLSLLGKGGMSSVYLAEHVLMRRRCAIKVLPTKRVNDTSYLGRFHREAQAVAALDHPNIVRAYDVDHEQDGAIEIHFLVMEYVDGASLLDMVNRHGPLSPVAAAEYIRQSAQGLEHAHRAGLIHRDVKPGNLLVDTNNVVKVMDLGLARFFIGDEASLTLQYDEKVLGTADYLAPEQAVDSHNIDARADIYSLGCTLYFLLSGHPPFREGLLPQRLMAHQSKEPPEIERADLPESLRQIMRRMMAKHPDDRYASAAEVSQTLLEWLQEHGGDQWAEMRGPLADSSPELGSGSGARLAAAAGSSSAPTPTAAVGESQEPKLAAPPAARPAPAPARPDADDALGSFLSQLSDSELREQAPPREQAAAAPHRMASGKPAAAAPVRGAAGAVRTPASPAPTPAPAAPRSRPIVAPATTEDEPVIVEALEAEPVESPTPQAESTLPRRKRAAAQRNKVLLAAGGGVGGLLLLIAAVMVLTGGEDEPAPQPPPKVSEPEVPGGNRPVAKGRPAPASPAEVTVGPEGNFATIDEALAYVARNAPLSGFDEPRLIRVAGGADYGPINIKGHFAGALHIKSEGETPAVLRSEGSGPLLSIDNSERVKIEGFRIDAAGKPVAVALTELLNGLQLVNLRIEGFTSAGIEAVRTKGLGRRRLELTGLSLIGGSGSAVGASFSDPSGLSAITISNVICAGPLQAGLTFDASLRDVQIQKCRFHDLQSGIVLPEKPWELASVAIENNTFHKVGKGIVMPTLPSPLSRLTLTKNLFSEIGERELALSSEPPPVDQLSGGGAIAFNWSTRPDGAAMSSGAIFQNQGKTAASVEFASTDPTAAEFLKPRGVELKAPGAPGRDKFIGAVAP